MPFAFAWGRDEGKVLDDGISPLHHGLAEVFLCGCSKKYQFRTQLPSPTFKQRTIHSKILQLPEFFLPVPFVCYMLQLCHFKEVKKQDALKKMLPGGFQNVTPQKKSGEENTIRYYTLHTPIIKKKSMARSLFFKESASLNMRTVVITSRESE